MIKKIANNFIKGEKVSKSITYSAFLIAGFGFTSRGLGLIRDRILAGKFGAGDVLDAYYAAFKIPDLVYNLLILGALSAAFIPIFSSLITKNKKRQAWELVNDLISIGSMVVVVVIILIWFFADSLVNILAFGYGDEKKEMVAQMTKIMLFSPLFLGISGIFGGILNSYKKFLFYSLAPIFYNLGIIMGALFLVDRFGYLGLAYGVVLGAGLHLLVQLPEVKRCGFKFKFSFNWKNKDLKKIIFLMIPRTLGIASAQLNLVVIVTLASVLPSGSLAIFNFANNLQSVPLGLFGLSFAVAAFPVLSQLWAAGDIDAFVGRLVSTLRKIIFFIIPISALIYVLRAQIVRVVLGSGKFDWEDTYLTFTALGFFTLSLWAQGIIPLLARSFYAMHNTKIPFLAGLFSSLINVAISLALIKKYGVLGLALAFSISNIVNALALFVLLRFKVGEMRGRGVVRTFLKILLATLIMGFVVQVLKNIIGAEPFGSKQTFLGILVQLIVATVGGGAVFVSVSWAMGVEELKHFMVMLHRKIIMKKSLPEDINSINQQ